MSFSDSNDKNDVHLADGSGEEEEELFSGSTHSFFIYFQSKRNYTGLIVSWLVIGLQITLYRVTEHYFWSPVGELKLIPVTVEFGDSCRTFGPKGDFLKTEIDMDNLECLPEVKNFSKIIVAGLLLSLFLMHDICASIKAMLTVNNIIGKFAGLVILAQTLFAFQVAVQWMTAATTAFDAISNCVGILFIADVDEKAFGAFKALKVNERMKKIMCCRPCTKSLLAAILPLVLIFGAGQAVVATFFIAYDDKLIKANYNGKTQKQLFDSIKNITHETDVRDGRVGYTPFTDHFGRKIYRGDPCVGRAPDMINGEPNRCRTNPDYPGYPGEPRDPQFTTPSPGEPNQDTVPINNNQIQSYPEPTSAPQSSGSEFALYPTVPPCCAEWHPYIPGLCVTHC